MSTRVMFAAAALMIAATIASAQPKDIASVLRESQKLREENARLKAENEQTKRRIEELRDHVEAHRRHRAHGRPEAHHRRTEAMGTQKPAAIGAQTVKIIGAVLAPIYRSTKGVGGN